MTFLQRQALRARAALLILTRGNPRWLPPPRMAQIEVTNRCDLFCRTCTRGKLHSIGDMPYEDFTRLIDELGPIQTLWLSGQGEPLLHPDLPRMVRYCADRGISGTIVHTNGMQLRGRMLEELAEAGLGELRVSIDGGEARDVEYLRDGSSLSRILDNTAAFSRRSSTPVGFYTVINRKNYKSLHRLPELAARCGARTIYAAETVPFRDTSSEREVFDRREYQFASLPPEERRSVLRDLRQEGRRHGVVIQVDLKWHRFRCQEPNRKIYVDYRGNVTPCCRIHYEVFVGNILDEGRNRVWYGTAMNRWRRSLRRRSEHPRICVERCNLGITPKR